MTENRCPKCGAEVVRCVGDGWFVYDCATSCVPGDNDLIELGDKCKDNQIAALEERLARAESNWYAETAIKKDEKIAALEERLAAVEEINLELLRDREWVEYEKIRWEKLSDVHLDTMWDAARRLGAWREWEKANADCEDQAGLDRVNAAYQKLRDLEEI